MKKTWFMPAVLIIFSLTCVNSVIFGQEANKKTRHNPNNLKYLDFERINFSYLEYLGLQYLEETDDETGQKIKPTISWLKNRENRWVEAFQRVATMLPGSFFKKIGKTSWTFNIDQNSWATASPGAINLLPSLVLPPWMTWEPLPVNGYSQEEMMFVALHELGHIYDGHSSSHDQHHGIYYWRYQGISWWNNDHLETISSIHCSSGSYGPFYGEEQPVFGVWSYKGTIFVVGTSYNDCHTHELFENSEILPLDGCVTLYGCKMGWHEDFAESIALYVMWPEYLKNNFYSHYTAINKILGKEYKLSYPMPNSIKSKLVVK